MQDYTKDLITELGKDVLSDTTESAIKDAINNALENGVQGKDIDFESLFNSVMESCARKILIDMCGDVEVVDSYNQKRLAGKFYKLITGQEKLESTNYVELNVIGNDSLKKIFDVYDYEKAVRGVVNALDNVKNAEDEAYISAVDQLAKSFLGLANTMADSVPVIGDMIKNMISVASGSFEYQYNYILNDLRRNNTAMASMVLYNDIEAAALYLLAQDNLIFEEEAIVTMLLDKMGVNINSPLLALIAFDATDHEDFIHKCAEAFGLLKEGCDYVDADLVRGYCVDILVERGYNIKEMTYEEIQKELSVLESNIKENEDENANSSPHNYFWNQYSFTYDTAFHIA